MPEFIWKGVNRKGMKKKGEMEGENENFVRLTLRRQGIEHDDFIKAVAKFGAEEFFNCLHAFLRGNLNASAAKTDAGCRHFPRAGI